MHCTSKGAYCIAKIATDLSCWRTFETMICWPLELNSTVPFRLLIQPRPLTEGTWTLSREETNQIKQQMNLTAEYSWNFIWKRWDLHTALLQWLINYYKHGISWIQVSGSIWTSHWCGCIYWRRKYLLVLCWIILLFLYSWFSLNLLKNKLVAMIFFKREQKQI